MHGRRAFTLIELMIVLLVTIALAAIAIPVSIHVGEGANSKRTALAVRAVAVAAATYGTASWTWIDGSGQARRGVMWDLNNDGQLDGDPSRDPAFVSSSPSANEAIAAGYAGFLAMAGISVPSKLERDGTVVDAWDAVLHIRMLPLAGAASWQVWSSGPDGISGTADDITSWTD